MTGCHVSMNYSIQDRSERVREFIGKTLESGGAPGIQYLVVQKDSILFSYAGGWADMAANRPLDEQTTMMIYSMTKTITAAAVLQLVDEGRISLEDPVTKHLPEFPYGSAVKVGHLLAQTSGIPNPIPLKWVHLAQEHARFDEQSALREISGENSELDFTPGEKYGYSNISYWELGQLVASVTGKSFEDVVREKIFMRLGLSSGEIDFVIPASGRHAKGYLPKWSFLNLLKSFLIDPKFVGEYENGWLHIEDHYVNGAAFGGVVATARAIGVFLQDQLRDSSRLFSGTTRALFFEQQRGNDSEPVGMTPGWHIGEENGVGYFFKEGGGGGFHCEMRIYPRRGIATVVIANNTSFDVKEFLKTADAEFASP